MNLIEDFLPINEFSRPGYKLNDLKAVVIHWVASPKKSAKAIRDYFAFDCPKQNRYASTQYCVGLQGEVIQMMPDNERAHHCGWANQIDPVSGKPYTDQARALFDKYTVLPYSPSYCTIGIETCHPDRAGKFSEITMNALIELVTNIFKKYPEKLNDPITQIITHKMVCGWKSCPDWYVKHPSDFEIFRQEVSKRLKA